MSTTSSALRHVGIHLRAFPIASEAFVVEQARTLTRYCPEFLVRELLRSDTGHEVRAIAPRWRRRLFALAPGPWAYGGRQALRGLDLIHAHFGPNGVYALPLSDALGIPLVVTFHGFDATVGRREMALHRGAFGLKYVLGLPRLKQRGARFLAVSDFLLGKLRDMGMPEERCVRHYVGVDLQRFRPVAAEQRSRDIVCVGRLVATKGIGDLIEAFAQIAPRVPDTRLRLIGEGRDRLQFERLVAELGLQSRVVFEGAQPHQRVAELVREGAVSVLASRTGLDGSQESFGLASIEAAAAGLPVIVTRHGGLPETVLEGSTGLVIPEADVPALADALIQLLRDDVLRARMGDAGRRYVEQKFNLALQTQALEEIYDEVLK